eukprot:scaffold11516_cov125-Isochrysis_galbana.AAC.2
MYDPPCACVRAGGGGGGVSARTLAAVYCSTLRQPSSPRLEMLIQHALHIYTSPFMRYAQRQ